MLRLPRSKASPLKTPKHTWLKRPHRHGNSVATTKACKSLRMLNATGGKHSSTPTPAQWKREPFANAFWEKPPKPPKNIEVGRSMVIICRRVFIGIPNFHKTKAGSKALYLYKFPSFALMKVRCTRIRAHFFWWPFRMTLLKPYLIGFASSNQGASFWTRRSQVTSPQFFRAAYIGFHTLSLSARVLFKRLNVSCERRFL